MINLMFRRGSELSIITVEHANLKFSKVQGQYIMTAPIEGLKLSVGGILQEFPDLEGKDIAEMRKIAIERIKEHVKKLQHEHNIKEYLREDLKKHGWILIQSQKKGFRPKKENVA